MRRVGWRNESWRHGLAAKGISSSARYMKGKSQFVRQTEAVQMAYPELNPDELKRKVDEIRIASAFAGSGERGKAVSPETELGYARSLIAQKRFAREAYADESAVGRLASGLEVGAYSVGGVSYSDVLNDTTGKYSAADKLQIRNALNAAAISAANLGQEFPKDAEKYITNDVKLQLKAIAKQKGELYEGPLKSALKEEGKEFAIASEKALVAAPGELVSGIGKGAVALEEYGAEGLRSAKAPAPGSLYPDVPGGLIPGDVLDTADVGVGIGSNNFFGVDSEKARKESLFFGGNPLTTAGDQENKAVGRLSPLADIPVDAYSKKAEGATRESELLTKEVESLWGAKGALADAALGSYKKGTESFKKGDREGLIRSINDLDAEEQKIRDRWMLVEQTRAFMLSPKVRASALRGEAGANVNLGGFGNIEVFGFGGGAGGKRLAENTQKINEVKREIKNAHNEVFARKTDLRYKLQRMDAQVPQQYDTPETVKVFDDKGSSDVLPDMFKPSVALNTAFGPRGE